jgi:hypothetical protein
MDGNNKSQLDRIELKLDKLLRILGEDSPRDTTKEASRHTRAELKRCVVTSLEEWREKKARQAQKIGVKSSRNGDQRQGPQLADSH